MMSKNTCITPGYRFSSRRSRNISMDPYHPVKGAAGNCSPPISANKQDTPGNGNHFKPKEAVFLTFQKLFGSLFYGCLAIVYGLKVNLGAFFR